MASDAQSKICLDIAVDHRIRKLLKPVPRYATEPSTHVSRLEQEGRSLQLPSAEIQVTAQLAGPPEKGGIAVMLQQPRDNHPFERGLEAVIDDCETLRALEEIFYVVSCGTLDFREDITVVDLLPYVSEKLLRNVDATRLNSAFRTSNATICAKNPDVLLCAGRIMIPPEKRGSVQNPRNLECIGIGERFGRKWPVKAKVRNEEQEYVELYSRTLDDISKSVGDFISTTQGYVDLRNSALSEKCNNANLILRQILRLKELVWQKSEAWKERKNKAALEQAAADTLHFTIRTNDFVKRPATKASTPPPQETPLAATLRQRLDSISKCVTMGQPRKKFELDLHGAANGFLQLAVDIETLLLDLLCKKEAALHPQGQEDLLSEQLSGLTLRSGMGALRA
ncbi:hypothetical protein LX32DRAFT_623988 [Colletotrichum zoysiae]|uniref:Uncharacterized protein n=1 Tax=Colletotrichum zoysiae TaxID=1216348 RepID=A0AAD9LYF7_9PEZI|nr:hypothetical protein LX32DRAFT_623988 [Colletotrichum zoysiae]